MELAKQKGVTLIELLVYITIMLMVFSMGYDFIVRGFTSTTFSSEQEEAIDNARKTVEILSEEIRGANNSDNGSYPIETMDEQEFIFYSDIDDDDSMEKIRYYIDTTDNTVKKVLTPAGPSSDYSGASETSTVASYVNNVSEPLFLYFDRNGDESSVINDVRMVGIQVKINVTPERAPNDYYVETNVHLRNLKDNL